MSSHTGDGGAVRSADNRFDTLNFTGYERMPKASQTLLLKNVMRTAMETCPTPEDRIASMLGRRGAAAPAQGGKGPSPALIAAMAIVGAIIGVGVARKSVSPRILVIYAVLCAAGGMASTIA